MGRHAAGLDGDTRTGAHGHPPKGAQYGDADTTDHPAIGKVLQGHYQSPRGCGLLWPGTVECGYRICRAALEWTPSEWRPPKRNASQWDALPRAPPEWDASQWDTLEWDRTQRDAFQWDAHEGDAPQWAAHTGNGPAGNA